MYIELQDKTKQAKNTYEWFNLNMQLVLILSFQYKMLILIKVIQMVGRRGVSNMLK